MADAPVHPPAGSVKLPGLGQVHKKTLMIGGLVAGGVLGYAYYRRSRNASAAGTGTAGGTMVTDPAGNQCAVLGASGYCPGTQADLAYQQQTSGYGTTSAIDPVTGLPLGSFQDQQALQDSGLGGTTTGTGTGTGTDPGAGGGITTPSATNAQWEQECIANLEAGGVSQATISDAEAGLPRYLASLTLSSAQATAVQLAVGLTGPPPTGGPYSIRVAPAPPPKVTPPLVAVPNVIGERGEAAKDVLTAAGFKVTQTPATTPKGKTTTVNGQSPKAGTKAAKGSTVHTTVKIT